MDVNDAVDWKARGGVVGLLVCWFVELFSSLQHSRVLVDDDAGVDSQTRVPPSNFTRVILWTHFKRSHGDHVAAIDNGCRSRVFKV